MPRCLQNGADSLAVQPALRDFGCELIGRLLRREGRPIWALLRHSLIRIGGRQDPSAQGYRVARGLAVVPGAVLPFVMHAS